MMKFCHALQRALPLKLRLTRGSGWFAAVLMATTLPAFSAPFEVALSPSRFEVSVKSAGRLGQSINLFNLGNQVTDVSVRTLDWTYSEDGNITYHDELLPDSCRPWVTLERKTVRLVPMGKSSFRFQIDVPADAPRGECRLMLAVEGVEPAYQAQLQGGGASLNLPISGRIAVAVYINVNGAQPKLEIKQLGVKSLNGKPTPVITVSNSGDAHARLEGGLEAVDAQNQKFDLIPEGTPILPGQTRTLPFVPRVVTNEKPIQITLPLKAQGQLDWDLGSFKIDAEFK